MFNLYFLWLQGISDNEHLHHKGQYLTMFWEFSSKGSFGAITVNGHLGLEKLFQYLFKSKSFPKKHKEEEEKEQKHTEYKRQFTLKVERPNER